MIIKGTASHDKERDFELDNTKSETTNSSQMDNPQPSTSQNNEGESRNKQTESLIDRELLSTSDYLTRSKFSSNYKPVCYQEVDCRINEKRIVPLKKHKTRSPKKVKNEKKRVLLKRKNLILKESSSKIEENKLSEDIRNELFSC